MTDGKLISSLSPPDRRRKAHPEGLLLIMVVKTSDCHRPLLDYVISLSLTHHIGRHFVSLDIQLCALGTSFSLLDHDSSRAVAQYTRS
jgi:hypothetical protein